MARQHSTAVLTLAKRRTEGKTGPLLDDALRPKTFDEAFSLQQAIGEIFAGVKACDVAGWKCCLPRNNNTCVAALYASTFQQQPEKGVSVCELHANPDGLAAIEPELSFVLKQDLPPRATPYTEAEIDAAIGASRMALELIQSRYDDPAQASFLDALADGMVNQGIWLGPELPLTTQTDLSEFLLTIQYANGQTETKPAKHPDGHPRAGLYWLVNFLSDQNIGLRKGQTIITGSYAGVVKVPFNQTINLRYGDIGEFTIEFRKKNVQ